MKIHLVTFPRVVCWETISLLFEKLYNTVIYNYILCNINYIQRCLGRVPYNAKASPVRNVQTRKTRVFVSFATVEN